MKKYSKIIALLLAFCMVVAFAACSKKPEAPAEPVEEAVEEVEEAAEEVAEDAEEAVEEAAEEVEEAAEEVAEDAEEAAEEAAEPAEEAVEEAAEEAAEPAEEAVEEAAEPAEEAAEEASNLLEGKTIGYVTISSAAPWGGLVGTELERIAKEHGATVRVLDAQTDVSKVGEYCQQMIDNGVDALCVFGGDPAANSEIAKAADEAGVGMFMCGLDVSEEGRQYVKACIGPDQEQAFYDIGQYIIEKNGADAELLVERINGVPFLADYIQRMAGFERAMSETNYILKDAADAYSSRSDAKTFMEQFIQSDGDDIDIVMGFDDDLTMGAVQAIEEAGMTGKVQVYSFTGQNDAIQAVKDGQIVLTVMNRAGDIAAETVNAMEEYFTTGETEYYHYTPLTYIDAENVDEFIGKGEF